MAPSRGAQRRRRKKLLAAMSPEEADVFRKAQSDLKADVALIKRRAARKSSSLVVSSPKEEDRH